MFELKLGQCDESKPICKRCKASSYLCNYGGNNAALEIVANGLSRLEAFDVVSFSLKSEGVDRYMFQENDLELLSKFRNRTTLTISTERVRDVYQNQIVEIAPYVWLFRSCYETHSYRSRAASISNAQPVGAHDDARQTSSGDLQQSAED